MKDNVFIPWLDDRRHAIPLLDTGLRLLQVPETRSACQPNGPPDPCESIRGVLGADVWNPGNARTW